MRIRRISAALGAEVIDVDLRDPGLDFAALYDAFLEHEVLFFRGVALTEEEHLALGRRFGTPSVYPIAAILGATEPTMTVLEDGPDSPNAADVWHTDLTWVERPPKAALLHMEVPATVGGDTLWVSATRAVEALSEPMRTFLAGLTAVHGNDGIIRRIGEKAGDAAEEISAAVRREHPPVRHPLIRRHPETGKAALLYAHHFLSHIDGLTELESRAVIDFVDDHVKDPALQCRWQWEAGDLAIWDERSTLHRSAADHWPHRRVIRRLEIDGDRPVAWART